MANNENGNENGNFTFIVSGVQEIDGLMPHEFQRSRLNSEKFQSKLSG